MNSEKILVTICNYNHNQYLKESIESIQNQSYENLDICIYDDGSEKQEEFLEIIEKVNKDSRIRTILSKNNRGKWFGLNEAIRTTDAKICTSHDADDISLKNRIERQLNCLKTTNTAHNLCGFYHCWNEDDIIKYKKHEYSENLIVIDSKSVYNLVVQGFNHPGINHYYTGNFETAGTSAMFYKQIWDAGIRFNPPNMGLRITHSEDSDFNLRSTILTQSTSILAEKVYLYRRETSTNREET